MEQFFFGTGRRCIDPEVPCSLAGYFNLRYWNAKLDDLEVRAVAMKQGAKEFLLVQFDLLALNEELYTLILKEIADLKQYNEKNVLFTATHTHTAPDTNPASKKGRHPEYVPFAAKKAAEAIRDAVASMHEGTVLAGQTADSRFQFNRRYWMKQGGVVTNPGKLNPNIWKPEGTIDPEIPMIAFAVNGKPEVLLAEIVNHTDTTDGCAVSADWAGHTRRQMQEVMGAGSMCFPLIGCAGNINHFDVSTDMNQTSPAEAKRIGTGYAETLKAALPTLKPVPDFTMKTVFREVHCKSSEVSDKELADAKATVAKYADVPDVLNSNISLTSEDLANKSPIALKYFAATLIAKAENKMDFRFRLTGISFGKVMIASLPSEPFVEIGLDIRKRFFSDYLCLAVSHGNGTGNLKNGSGYIPNYWNYYRGGYETEVRSNPFEQHLASYLREAWADVARNHEL